MQNSSFTSPTIVICAFIKCVRQITKHMICAFLIVNPSDVPQGVTISKSSQKWLCFFLCLVDLFDPEIKCDNNFLLAQSLAIC